MNRVSRRMTVEMRSRGVGYSRVNRRVEVAPHVFPTFSIGSYFVPARICLSTVYFAFVYMVLTASRLGLRSALQQSQRAANGGVRANQLGSLLRSSRAYSSQTNTGPSALRKWSIRLCKWTQPDYVRMKRGTGLTTVLLIAFPVTYVAGAAMPPKLVLMLYPRYSPPPPDKDSSLGRALTNDIEQELQRLFIVDKLRHKEGWYETRTCASFPHGAGEGAIFRSVATLPLRRAMELNSAHRRG